MRVLCFLEYDISEGLVRFWKRYLWLVVLTFIVCLLFDRESAYFQQIYHENWSPLGYGINAFFGQSPFHFDLQTSEDFQLPFAWILQFVLLSYCVGNYVAEDIHGFGMQMMFRSGSRILWWCSKCSCCILINVFYFSILYGVIYAYTWIKTGNVAISGQAMLPTVYYGDELAQVPLREKLFMVVLLPLLVGIVQSLAQIILLIYMNSATVMSIITFILVLSAYYGDKLLVHGYAMVCRYIPDAIHPEDGVLTSGFGIPYLLGWTVALILGGYVLIRKRNII